MKLGIYTQSFCAATVGACIGWQASNWRLSRKATSYTSTYSVPAPSQRTLKPKDVTQAVLVETQTLESLVSHLRSQSLEAQMKGWDAACASLLQAGRWKEAIDLALRAPSIRVDEQGVFSLMFVMRELSKTRAPEVMQWLESKIAQGDKESRGTLSALLDAWQVTDKTTCLEALRGMKADSTLLRYTRKRIFLEVLRDSPQLVKRTDLELVYRESEQPQTVIREIGNALGGGSLNASLQWAVNLETSAQRSMAVEAIAYGAATVNNPELWQMINLVKDVKKKESITSEWASRLYLQAGKSAEDAVLSVPDPTLRSAAASGMVAAAASKSLPEAVAMAQFFEAQNNIENVWEAVISKSGFDPAQWLDSSQFAPLQTAQATLTVNQRAALMAAASKLHNLAK